jgi:ribA/ribD-fused uncharacterized protein
MLDGTIYHSIEHAFQAAKTLDPDERFEIYKAPSPGQAKKLGRQVRLRSDWETVKLEVMEYLLVQKFKQGSPLAKLLVETGDSQLVEGNTWGDTYWGVCNGIGENNLGKLLMKIRGGLQSKRL